MTTTGKSTCWSLSIRPRLGVGPEHFEALKLFYKTALQYETVLEYAVADDPTTKHLHARVLFADAQDRRNVKRRLRESFKKVMDQEEMANLMRKRSLGYLYDDWLSKYSTNNPEKEGLTTPVEDLTHLTDEAAWEYSTEAMKKNSAGWNQHDDMKEKAQAFLGSEFVDPDGCWDLEDVKKWYMNCCCEGKYTFPTAQGSFRMKLDNISFFARYLFKRPELADSDSEIF